MSETYPNMPADFGPRIPGWLRGMVFDLSVIYGPNERDRVVIGDHHFAMLALMHEKFMAGLLVPKPLSESDFLLQGITTAAAGRNIFPTDAKKQFVLNQLKEIERSQK